MQLHSQLKFTCKNEADLKSIRIPAMRLVSVTRLTIDISD